MRSPRALLPLSFSVPVMTPGHIACPSWPGYPSARLICPATGLARRRRCGLTSRSACRGPLRRLVPVQALQPAPRPGARRCIGAVRLEDQHPHTRLETSLAQVQRRHPLHHQIGVVDFLHSKTPSNAADDTKAVARRNRTGMEESRTLVLVATMRSPTTGSRIKLKNEDHFATPPTSTTTAPDFPACARVPKGPRTPSPS